MLRYSINDFTSAENDFIKLCRFELSLLKSLRVYICDGVFDFLVFETQLLELVVKANCKNETSLWLAFFEVFNFFKNILIGTCLRFLNTK